MRRAVGSGRDPRAAAARLRPDSSDAGGEAPVISPSVSSRLVSSPFLPRPHLLSSSLSASCCALRVELGFVAGGRAGEPLLSGAERRESGESGERGWAPLVPWPSGRQLPGGAGSTGSDAKLLLLHCHQLSSAQPSLPPSLPLLIRR